MTILFGNEFNEPGIVDPVPDTDLSQSVPLQKIDEQRTLTASLEQTIRELKSIFGQLKTSNAIDSGVVATVESIAPDIIASRTNLKGFTKHPSRVGLAVAMEAIDDSINLECARLFRSCVDTLEELKDDFWRNLDVAFKAYRKNDEFSDSFDQLITSQISDETAYKKILESTVCLSFNPLLKEIFEKPQQLSAFLEFIDETKQHLGVLATFSNNLALLFKCIPAITDQHFNSVEPYLYLKADFKAIGEAVEVSNFYRNVISAANVPVSSDFVVNIKSDVYRTVSEKMATLENSVSFCTRSITELVASQRLLFKHVDKDVEARFDLELDQNHITKIAHLIDSYYKYTEEIFIALYAVAATVSRVNVVYKNIEVVRSGY